MSSNESDSLTPNPSDTRASIAVDLGAESCRVSLLRWMADGSPEIRLVERFSNAPHEIDGGLRWDLNRIVTQLDDALRRCAAIATEGIRSIAVDGWAVDYVRLDRSDSPLEDPFCYRDERTIAAESRLHQICAPQRLRELTGVQLLRINTLYQLYADVCTGEPPAKWMNLPEYVLFRWGGRRVAELTNATHTEMLELNTREWCKEIFDAAGVDLSSAPPIVPPGTLLGRLTGPLAELSAFRDTALIAPACHDTASAIAGIPAMGDDWAYISSGTWSLVGTLVEHPKNGPAEREENFTNLGAVGGGTCFHKNVNGMWLIRQCMECWSEAGQTWSVAELVAACIKIEPPQGLLNVDDPDLMLAGRMVERINVQRVEHGLAALDESPQGAPAFASLIFHSLAARYAEVLRSTALYSGKKLARIFIVGGGSRNEFLNRLTEKATGLRVFPGSAESSTVGNFAVQMATLDGHYDATTGVDAGAVSRWAKLFVAAMESGPPVA